MEYSIMKKTASPIIVLSSLCALFLCKQTLKEGDTLTTAAPAQNTAQEQSPVIRYDTVVIEPDTTAIDVKEAEIAPEILEQEKPVYHMDIIENQGEGSVL